MQLKNSHQALPNWRNLSYYVAETNLQICLVLRLIFIGCMVLCNYPIAIAVSVNQFSPAQWPASLRNRNAKYIGPECAYAIIGQTSDLAAFPLQSTFAFPAPDKVTAHDSKKKQDWFALQPIKNVIIHKQEESSTLLIYSLKISHTHFHSKLEITHFFPPTVLFFFFW